MRYLADIEDVKLYTLDELETFFNEKKIPQDKIRFFVNVDSSEPKCFGIYQDSVTGNYIVYKNKADGSRFIRYEGKDEKEAVNIFFSKLKDEMALRGNKTINADNKKQVSRKPLRLFIVFIIVIILVSVILAFTGDTYQNGYYCYNNQTYYYQDGDFYYYDDDLDDWLIYNDIIDSQYYDNDYDTSDIKPFESSSYYSDSDFDDYDYDSWDSDTTNWDSDW